MSVGLMCKQQQHRVDDETVLGWDILLNGHVVRWPVRFKTKVGREKKA